MVRRRSMRDTHFTTRVFRQFIARFSGNAKKSILNPHDVDELVDRLNALSNITIIAGTKNKAHLGSQSMILEINLPTVISDSGGGTQRFKITQTFDEFETLADYFAAQMWSDSANDYTGDTVHIAKHFKNRSSLVTETIFGTVVTYTYADNNHRTTTAGGSQDEQLQPPIQVGDEIYCSKLITPDSSITVVEDSSHPEWVDSTSRLWAKKNS
jgi:hypothetical protein